MAKKKPVATPDINKDLNVVDKLWRAGKLDLALESLNPGELVESLKKAPPGLVRLLLGLLYLPDISERLAGLSKNVKAPVVALLKAADRLRTLEYTDQLIEAARGGNKDIDNILGIDVVATVREKSKSSTLTKEQKAQNSITGLRVTPMLMLNSGRLYSQVIFLQNDDHLLRSTLEVDEMVSFAKSFVVASKDCLAAAAKRTSKAKTVVATQLMQRDIKEIIRVSREIATFLGPPKLVTKKGSKSTKKQRK